MKTTLKISLLMLLAFVAVSCTDDITNDEKPSADGLVHSSATSTDENMAGPHLRIAVISDIHLMAPSLLTNGGENSPAFLYYLASDPKLVHYSTAIFSSAVDQLKVLKPDILLITGDLTKDGERVSHELLTEMLSELTDTGIKVYVIPGNHDINNPEAVAYDGDKITPVQTITPREFAAWYAPYGYEDAIARDEGSPLSYVAEPVPGLRILAIDAARYEDNTSHAIVSGTITAKMMSWIKAQLDSARKTDATVIAMMHHNLLDHYPNQSILQPGYAVDDWQTVADTLIASGLRVIFTGHNHGNDITLRSFYANEIYDVETGSLVNMPFPIRLATLKNKELSVTTYSIKTVDAGFPGGMDFNTYSSIFFNGYLDTYFTYGLMQAPYSLPDSVAATVAPRFRNAFLAYQCGDEQISPQEQRTNESLAAQSPLAGWVLQSFWTDQYPKDNKWHFRIR